MSHLKNCPACQAKISSNAAVCPKCSHQLAAPREPYVEKRPCRVCKAALPLERHRVVQSHRSERLLDGTTQVSESFWVEHQACPNCGEPEPLRRRSDSRGYRWLLYIVFLCLGWTAANVLIADYGFSGFSWPMLVMLIGGLPSVLVHWRWRTNRG